VDAEGVLRYNRQKTGELAVVPLPAHLLKLLHDVPLEKDSIGPEQPFRTNVLLASDTARWARRIQELFRLAGIEEVETPFGMKRTPHTHMLRDSFAVGALRSGAHLHTVSRMLGHSKTNITEGAYLPWVPELQKAHLEDARQALTRQMRKKNPTR
jgi:integrase